MIHRKLGLTQYVEITIAMISNNTKDNLFSDVQTIK